MSIFAKTIKPKSDEACKSNYQSTGNSRASDPVKIPHGDSQKYLHWKIPKENWPNFINKQIAQKNKGVVDFLLKFFKRHIIKGIVCPF